MCKITYVNRLSDKIITLLVYYLLNTSIGSKLYYYEKIRGRLRRSTTRFSLKRKKMLMSVKKRHHLDWYPFETKVTIPAVWILQSLLLKTKVEGGVNLIFFHQVLFLSSGGKIFSQELTFGIIFFFS